jgi:hypothetical protein
MPPGAPDPAPSGPCRQQAGPHHCICCWRAPHGVAGQQLGRRSLVCCAHGLWALTLTSRRDIYSTPRPRCITPYVLLCPSFREVLLPLPTPLPHLTLRPCSLMPHIARPPSTCALRGRPIAPSTSGVAAAGRLQACHACCCRRCRCCCCCCFCNPETSMTTNTPAQDCAQPRPGHAHPHTHTHG